MRPRAASDATPSFAPSRPAHRRWMGDPRPTQATGPLLMVRVASFASLMARAASGATATPLLMARVARSTAALCTSGAAAL
eukprot:3554971-Prymnesium_polylepis.1